TIAQDFLESVESTLHETIAKERANQKVLNYVGLNFSLFLFATIFITLVIQRRRELLLMARLEKLAAYDELTGLLNRRQFDSILSHEWSHAMRTKTPISIVICDIDFFKQYNDRLGHQAGDACLRSVALVMQSILRRPVDSVSRYGGEEFAFVFPLTDEKGAKKMIDTLHSSLKNRKIPHPGSPVSHNVTLTAGLASVVPGPDHTISRFIMEADQALYRGKKEGRNRTCCAEWTTDSATADKKILTN
ncbi:MAG: diguanylate cyclase, partial [Nitrospinota bacterium]